MNEQPLNKDGTRNKREVPARQLVSFLLEIVPQKYRTYREFIQRIANKPMALFVVENRKWLADNLKPEERVNVYKKLDVIPQEIGGIEPWGYYIVNKYDKYAYRYYKRSLSDANAIRRNNIEKWAKFKADYVAPRDTDYVPEKDIRIVEAPVPKKPVHKLDSQGRLVWSDDLKRQFIELRVVQELKLNDVAERMGITYAKVMGVNSRYNKGGLDELKAEVLSKQNPNIAVKVNKEESRARAMPPVRMNDDLKKEYLRKRLIGHQTHAEIVKDFGINEQQVNKMQEMYRGGEMDSLVQDVLEEHKQIKAKSREAEPEADSLGITYQRKDPEKALSITIQKPEPKPAQKPKPDPVGDKVRENKAKLDEMEKKLHEREEFLRKREEEIRNVQAQLKESEAAKAMQSALDSSKANNVKALASMRDVVIGNIDRILEEGDSGRLLLNLRKNLDAIKGDVESLCDNVERML